MKHQASKFDTEYLNRFRAYQIDASTFHHKQHLLVAYTLLTENNIEGAYTEVKFHILGLLNHLGANTNKYHETMTYAWLLAVNHFMAISAPCNSFDEFIQHNPVLLNSKIMLSHYSEDLLFSDAAKERFMQPNLEPIPLHSFP